MGVGVRVGLALGFVSEWSTRRHSSSIMSAAYSLENWVRVSRVRVGVRVGVRVRVRVRVRGGVRARLS